MSSKTIFMILGAFVAVWSILGFMDVGNLTTSGYSTDFDNNVTGVTDGGPAEAAGMQVGDKLRSMNGISMEDVRSLTGLARPAAGETRAFTVDRDGETAEVSLTYAEQSSTQRTNAYIGILIGLCFLVMGLWAFFTVPSRATKLLAIVGVCFGITFGGGPYLGASTMANIAGGILFMVIALAFAALLHFMIVFPDKAEPNTRLLYGPAVLLALFIMGLNIFQPNATSGLNRFVQVVFTVWIFSYLGLSLFKMVRTWIGASAEDRSRHGLTLLMVGTGLGLGILLASVLIGILVPTLSIPGWLGVSLVLVPISSALAAVKSARAGGEATAA